MLLDGVIRPEIDFNYVLTPTEVNSGYVLACQSTPKTDLKVTVNLSTKETSNEKSSCRFCNDHMDNICGRNFVFSGILAQHTAIGWSLIAALILLAIHIGNLILFQDSR